MQNTRSWKLRSSHHQLPAKPHLVAKSRQSVSVSSRQQALKEKEGKERRRLQEEKKIVSIRARLLARFDPELHPESDGDGARLMERLNVRLWHAAQDAVQRYRPSTGRFSNFPKVLNQFCRLQLALTSSAEAVYVERQIRRNIDRPIVQLERILAVLDRSPIDARTYELLLSREINAILEMDLAKIGMAAIREVEYLLVGLADAGRRVEHHSKRGYTAVMIRSGVGKRTDCFLILDPLRGPKETELAMDETLPTILTMKTKSEYNRAQRRRKGEVPEEHPKQKFAHVPRHLRHH